MAEWENDEAVRAAVGRIIAAGDIYNSIEMGMAIHAYGAAVAAAVAGSGPASEAVPVPPPPPPSCPPHFIINGDRSCRACGAPRPDRPPCTCVDGVVRYARLRGYSQHDAGAHQATCALRQHLIDWAEQ